MAGHVISTVRLATAWLWLGFGAVACSTDSTDGGDKGAAGAANASAGTGASGSGAASANGGSAGAVNGTAGTTNGTAGTANGSAGAGAAGGGAAATGCDAPGLTWKTARKTWYTSYPDPGSEECVKYNGCMYEGQFAACDDTLPEASVAKRNIVAAFPDYDTLKLHDLCLKSGDKTIVVTVLDTCGDDDCDGCCTQNKGKADELIDIESYTNDRFGVEDGQIQWADLGPTPGDGCSK